MPFTITSRRSIYVCLMASQLFVLAFGSGLASATEENNAIAPKLLLDFASPDAGKQVGPNKPGVPPSMITVDKSGISMSWPIQPAQHSGVIVTPASGKTWDLSAYGHVEAKVTNTGHQGLFNLVMLVVDETGSYWRWDRKIEYVFFKPGETKNYTVPLGNDNFWVMDFANTRGKWGGRAGAVPNKAKVAQIQFFVYDTKDPQSFHIEDLKAAGTAGKYEGLYAVDPASVRMTPENGGILGTGVVFDPVKQIEGGPVAAGPDGAIALHFAGGKEETVKIKPLMGAWNLGQANQIRVRFTNTGQVAVSPTVAIGSNKATVEHPIAPGAEEEVVASFLPNVTPVVAADPRQQIVGPGKWEDQNSAPRKDTGTTFESNDAKTLSISSDTSPGAKSLLVTSIVADAAIDQLPDWLGKKPPVDGQWIQTLDEKFDDPALDPKRWNVHGENPWDKWTHFSQDNVVLKNGKLLLHYEKKTGSHNDDTNNAKIAKTEYASGCVNTYGKWTQKYGYFESRMKLPAAPGLWPTFCLLPDRGQAAGEPAMRTSTAKEAIDAGVGGMEFDIMDFLSGWGTYRYNIACHWDGYVKNHKSAGSPNIYVRPDKDGYITPGLLWTPGLAIMYNNGKEVFRWEGQRVGDVPCYLMLDMVSGGWTTTKDVPVNSRLNDAKLPDDFIIDYVRAWQRKDLATPEDGPKPSKNDPSEKKN